MQILEEYLIPDALRMILGFLEPQIMSGNLMCCKPDCVSIINVTTEAQGIAGEEGSFEAIDKSYDSFNASLGYKTNLADDLTLRLNVASGFRAPNLAELTSNGVHEGTNRYEVGNSDLETEQNIQTDLNLEYKTGSC
jgi:iron complex outermembrane receptor protein